MSTVTALSADRVHEVFLDCLSAELCIPSRQVINRRMTQDKKKTMSWKGLGEAFMYAMGALAIYGLTQVFGRLMLIPLAVLIAFVIFWRKWKKKKL